MTGDPVRYDSDPWERYYASGGPGWKGSPFSLPELNEGARVLDVGCGTGSTMIQADERGFDITGIDISESAILRCRSRLDSRGIQAPLIQYDYLNWDTSSRFDCILLHHFLSSLREKEREDAVGKTMELLSDGGLISFQDFSTGDFRFGRGEEVEYNTYLKGNGILCHFFTENEVRDLFHGCDVIVMDTGSWSMGDRIRSRIRALLRRL